MGRPDNTMPRDGSMFGAVRNGIITALIPIYTKGPPAGRPLPNFSVMLLAGAPRSEWPSFAREELFGDWFRKGLNAGEIVNVAPGLSETQGFVFWSEAAGLPGYGALAAVERDLIPEDGDCWDWTLREGVYAYRPALESGKSLPSLAEVLADPGKVDIGPRLTGF